MPLLNYLILLAMHPQIFYMKLLQLQMLAY